MRREYIIRRIFEDGTSELSTRPAIINADPLLYRKGQEFKPEPWGCISEELVEDLSDKEFKDRFFTEYRNIEEEGRTYYSNRTKEYYELFQPKKKIRIL